MKNKTIGFLIIILLILGTLFLSNYYIDYYQLSDQNKYIISTNTTLAMRRNNVLKGKEIQEVYDKTKTLKVKQNDIEYAIADNENLDFFKNTKEIIIDQESDINLEEIPNFNLDNQAIQNLESMPNLDTITYNYQIDDYLIKQEYSYTYTPQEQEEFVNNVKEKIQNENKNIIEKLKDAKIEVQIKIEVI